MTRRKQICPKRMKYEKGETPPQPDGADECSTDNEYDKEDDLQDEAEEKLPHKIPSAHVSSLLPPHRHKSETDHVRQTPTQSDGVVNHKHNKASPSSAQRSSNDSPLDLTCKSSRTALKSICSNSSSVSPPPYENKSSSLNSLESKFGGSSSIIEKMSSSIENSKNPLYNAFGGNLYTSALYNTAPLMTTDQLYRPDRKYWPLSVTSPLRHNKPTRSDEHKNYNNNNTTKSTHVPATQSAVKKVKSEPNKSPPTPTAVIQPDKDDPLRYTNLVCSCQQQYETLYDLTMHMQRTGHIANQVTFTEHTEYPKLVRGQDMWLNQGSEQTRQILRCMQCAESFKSLPELTIHMIKTKHYTNIVGGESKKVHRCSSYCDKCDDASKSVFRCKVCNDRFTCMEHLADHMMVSGHYMKASRNGSNHDSHELRSASPRQSQVKLSPSSYNQLASHHLPLSYNDEIKSDLDADDNTQHSNDSSIEKYIGDYIRCENCDEKICADIFVEHVRLCVKTRLSPIENKPLCELDTTSTDSEIYNKDPKKIKSEPENDVEPDTKTEKTYERKKDILSTPKGRALQEYYKEQQSPKSHKSSSVSPSLQDKYLRPESPITSTAPSGFMESLKNCIDKHTTSTKSKISPYALTFAKQFKLFSPTKTSEHCFTGRNFSFSSKLLAEPEASNIDKIKLMQNRTQENRNGPRKHYSDLPANNRNSPGVQVSSKPYPQTKKPSSLRDFSPSTPPSPHNTNGESTSSSANSALEAMQSFIDRSFMGNGLLTSSPSKKKHTQKMSSIKMPNEKPKCHTTDKSYFTPDKKCSEKTLDSVTSNKPATETGKNKKTSIKEEDYINRSNSPPVKSNNTNVFEKYLTAVPTATKKANALQSLHGLVYGDGVESEHPLDSLQKLIHTTDVVPSQRRTGSNGHSSSVVKGTALPSNGQSLPSTVILVNPVVTVMSNSEKDESTSVKTNIPSKKCSNSPPASPPNRSSTPSSHQSSHAALSPTTSCSGTHSPATITSVTASPLTRSPLSHCSVANSPVSRSSIVPSPLSPYSPMPPSPANSHSPIPSSRTAGSGADSSDLDSLSEDLLCKSCKLSFSSRSEYRLHQRYCPVSSYSQRKESLGITSPYIYLPMDHSVNFNKYYEMANELASKNKASIENK